MATKPRKKIGRMPCEGQRCESHEHGAMVTVYESESGTLGYHCDYCDRGPYAKPGTAVHREWLADIKPLVAAPAPVVAGAVPEAPAKADVSENTPPPKKSGFSLGGLSK